MNIEITKIPVGVLSSNCYIISSESLSKVLIIDAGGDFLKIKEIVERKLNKEMGALIITHCHYDHVEACHLYEENGVPIFMTSEDEKLINSSGNLSELFGEKLLPFKVTNYLEEGKMNIVGFEVEIIFTPGHTKGSCCIKIGSDIFTGDTMFKYSFGRTDFPTGSMDDLKESAKKLFKFDDNCVIYPGHGVVSTLSAEKKYNPINEYLKG